MEQGLKGIFALFGGLALFLYGMDALSRSLETAAGQRMKRLLMVLVEARAEVLAEIVGTVMVLVEAVDTPSLLKMLKLPQVRKYR